jgi:hypothetical protein
MNAREHLTKARQSSDDLLASRDTRSEKVNSDVVAEEFLPLSAQAYAIPHTCGTNNFEEFVEGGARNEVKRRPKGRKPETKRRPISQGRSARLYVVPAKRRRWLVMTNLRLGYANPNREFFQIRLK